MVCDSGTNSAKKSIFDGIWDKKLKATSKGTPELAPSLTGKVIVYKDKDQSEVLDGVYFSNVDLNWYDAEGNLHPLMEKFHGRKWSMKFKFTDKDRFGKEHEFESMLLCPLGLGEMGQIDWEGIPDCEQLEASFGIERGAFFGYDDPYLKQFLTGAACSFIGFVSPDKKLTEIEPLVIFLSFALLFDDQVDNNTFFNKQLTFEEISIVRDKMVEVLLGLKEPDEQDIDFDFPQMKPLCRYILYMRESLLKKAATREICERWFTDMTNYFNAVVVDNAGDWNDYKRQCKTGTHHRAHWDIRRLDSGCLPTWSCQLITYGNKLSKKIHDSFLYQYYRRLAIDHIVFTNDLFSYKKECNDKETCNAVYTRHHDEGRDFMEVLESCVTDANNVAIDMFEMGQLLMKLHNKDKYLSEAIYLLKANCLGHIQWYNYALRYHNGIVFDAVVHSEDDDWKWSMEEDK